MTYDMIAEQEEHMAASEDRFPDKTRSLRRPGETLRAFDRTCGAN